jgi:hypothetical protein
MTMITDDAPIPMAYYIASGPNGENVTSGVFTGPNAYQEVLALAAPATVQTVQAPCPSVPEPDVLGLLFLALAFYIMGHQLGWRRR